MSDIRRVLVIGGGVGGLTTATSFAQRGVEVLLVERRPAFDVPGVGLGQPANALRIYDALGLLPDILASGFPYDRMSIFDPKRELIVEHKFLLGDDRVPAFCALSRLRLHEILLAAAERAGANIRTGLTVNDIQGRKRSGEGDFFRRSHRRLRPYRRLRRHSLDNAAVSVSNGLHAAPVRLRRLAGASAAP